MIMRKIIILVCYCFLLAACGNSAKTNNSTSADSTATEVVDIHNAETSLDYEGTYKGVFPAADGHRNNADTKPRQDVYSSLCIHRPGQFI